MEPRIAAPLLYTLSLKMANGLSLIFKFDIVNIHGIPILDAHFLQLVEKTALAQHLIKADRFSENRFIIRPFSIVGTVFTSCFFVFSAGYFLLFKVFHLAAFFGFALFGYLWVKVNTYCVRVSYTDDTLFYQAWRTKKEIPFSGIHRICWESVR